MKTFVVLVVVGVIAFFSIRSLVKMLRGEGGCHCSKDNSCELKDFCKSKKSDEENRSNK